MDGQLLELWGRLLTTTLNGHNQMDTLGGWWLRSLQNFSSMSRPYSMSWTMPSSANSTGANMFDGLQQMWEPVLKMQQQSFQSMGMVPKEKYERLSEHAEELESKIKEQAKTIDRLRNLLRQTGGENNVVVNQLQDLIGQQSQQFKQLTESVGDYIKGGSKKESAKK